MKSITAQEYFSRQTLVNNFGLQSQAALQQAKVLVIGAGGLGCPVLQYLGGSGVGHICVVDDDVVSGHNLHRQILFSVNDIGKKKVVALKEHWHFPFTDLKIIVEKLTIENVRELFSNYDVIVDTTDNFATRYLVNDACVILNKQLVSASINQFEGQLGVYNYTDENGNKSGSYRCLFPTAPVNQPTCSEAGVLATTAGFIGLLQANEVIKLITKKGNILTNQLLIYDVLKNQQTILNFKRDEKTIAEIISKNLTGNYDDSFCETDLREITTDELQKCLAKNEDLQLIDVRETYEHEAFNIGGVNIPLSEIIKSPDLFSKNKTIILYCEKGERSRIAQQRLSEKFGFTNLVNLKGGVKNWKRGN